MRYEEETRAAHADLVGQVQELRREAERAEPWAASLGRLGDAAVLPDGDRAPWPQARGDALTFAQIVEQVLAVHHPQPSPDLRPEVAEHLRHLYVACGECRSVWPCPTFEHVRSGLARHAAWHLAGIACRYC